MSEARARVRERDGQIIEALAELRRVGGSYAGPFGAIPSSELVTLADAVLAETATALCSETELPLPTRRD